MDVATRKFLLGTDKLSTAAKEAGARSLALDPNTADIHRAMANVVLFFEFDWDAADAGLNKARALDPGNARIAEQSALLAITTGRLTEGLALATLAASMDPLGTAYWAAAAYRRLIERHPTKAGAHFRTGLVLLSQGQPQTALEQMEQDEPWYRQTGVALALDALARRADADRTLAIADMNWGNGMAYQISYIYAARGDAEKSIAWLERAYTQRDSGFLSMALDPMLASLIDKPAFKASYVS